MADSTIVLDATNKFPAEGKLKSFQVVAAVADPTCLMECKYDTIIDSIRLMPVTAGTASGTYSFENSSTCNGTTGERITTADIAADGAAGTVVAGTMDTTKNLIPAGNFLMVDVTATETAFRGLIEIRYRERRFL